MNQLVCPKNIETFFERYGQRRSIYLKNREEIEQFKDYLGFDYVKYQEQKYPTNNPLVLIDCIVSCEHKESIVVEFEDDPFRISWVMLEQNWSDKVKLTLTMKEFFFPEEYPEKYI